MNLFLRLAFFLLPAFLCMPALAQQKATADAGKTDFSGNAILTLDGNWEFYWNKLCSPSDFKTDSALHPDLLVKPSSWNALLVNGKACGSYGYCTWRITLSHLPEQELALDVYSIQTASRIFVNGTLAAESGYVGKDVTSSSPMTRDVQVTIPAGLEKAEIIIQCSNFHHRKGGFVHAPEIGSLRTISNHHLLIYILDAIESSALAIIGLFLLALYIFRRKDLSVLWFSLFCITLSLRPVISVNYLLATLMQDISWSLMLRLEYLSVLFPCLFMTLYIRRLFPEQLPSLIVKIFTYIFILKICITLFFPPSVFSWLVLPLLVLIPIGILVLTITITRAVLAKVEGANYAGIGIIVLFVGLILKVLSYSGIIPAMHVLITVLDICFIFTMSLILGSRFSLQFVKVELLQIKTERQGHEIMHQKQEVERQREIMSEKNREILDSITYAKRLQQAIFPSEKHVQEFLPDSFILYQPKDIVAGDFYWMEVIPGGNEQEQLVLFAVADCTGHGVPGAMTSLVCNNALNRSVREFGLTEPAAILNKTREIVIAEFEKSAEEVNDGMDISCCSVCYEKQSSAVTIKWAGANNPIWYVQQGEPKEIKGDKQPIGKYAHAKPFTPHSIRLQKGDALYLFTDGYIDQFGGEKGKKFNSSKLREFLFHITSLPMNRQSGELLKHFTDWKGELDQVDDVCIFGIRL